VRLEKVFKRGDIVAQEPAKAEPQAKGMETFFLVLDTNGTKVLATPITVTVPAKPSQEILTNITKDDIESGNAEYCGVVQLNSIVSLNQTSCTRAGSLKSEKLDEVLRLFTRYAASIYFDSFHKPRQRKSIPAAGKLTDADDLFNSIDAALDMWWTTGRFAQAFERRFPEKIGLKHCALVNSGSSANLLALSALTSRKLGEKRLKPGDEVITVAAAFPTTIAPIVQNNLVPVFVDVELGTYNFNPELLEKAISKKTRAIFMAHTLGNPFDVEKAKEVAVAHDLWLVEDNCDALGSEYDGKFTGTFGDLATFSFYPAHHITMGEGGAVVTNDSQVDKIVCSMRDWGRDCWCPPGKDNTCHKRFSWKLGSLPEGYDHKYIYSHLGYNLKSTDFQAAIGLSQLAKLDAFVRKRRSNFKLLYTGFKTLGLDEYFILPKWLSKSNPSWFGFPLTINEKAKFHRKELIEFLEKRGIGTRLLFAGNILRQPAVSNADLRFRVVGELKNTDTVCRDNCWIGVWPGISNKDIDYMLDTFASFLSGLKNR
jgi:CDP-4-dehydro-6-deoxyglucose reductase, E1